MTTTGARVAILTTGNSTTQNKVRIADVERVSAKSVTVDGERYPLNDLKLRKGGTWGWYVEIRPLDDAEVIEIRTEQIRLRRASLLAAALEAWRREPTPPHALNLQAAMAKVQELLG